MTGWLRPFGTRARPSWHMMLPVHQIFQMLAFAARPLECTTDKFAGHGMIVMLFGGRCGIDGLWIQFSNNLSQIFDHSLIGIRGAFAISKVIRHRVHASEFALVGSGAVHFAKAAVGIAEEDYFIFTHPQHF